MLLTSFVLFLLRDPEQQKHHTVHLVKLPEKENCSLMLNESFYHSFVITLYLLT